MKISKTALLILGIGIFVIVMGSLGAVYMRQRGEQATLDDSLSVAQADLRTLASEEKDWESQLTQLESELAQATVLLNAAKLKFPHPVESIEVDEKLFIVADNCELEVTSLTADEPSEEDIEDVIFSVTSFAVDVEGEVDGILSFISTIANDWYFTNATVELVNISIPEPPSEEEEEEEPEKPSARIKIVIYSYQGEGE